MVNPESHKKENISIPGIDTEKGIAMTGGRIDFYMKILDVFLKDAEKRLPNIIAYDPEAELLPFITEVHALKGASASIGAGDFSKKAGEIESAGKNKNLDFIEKNLESFISDFQNLIKNIKLTLEVKTTNGEQKTTSRKLLKDLALALESVHIGNIDKALAELEKNISKDNTEPEIIESFEAISDNILITEYEAALEIVNNILNKGSNNGN